MDTQLLTTLPDSRICALFDENYAPGPFSRHTPTHAASSSSSTPRADDSLSLPLGLFSPLEERDVKHPVPKAHTAPVFTTQKQKLSEDLTELLNETLPGFHKHLSEEIQPLVEFASSIPFLPTSPSEKFSDNFAMIPIGISRLPHPSQIKLLEKKEAQQLQAMAKEGTRAFKKLAETIQAIVISCLRDELLPFAQGEKILVDCLPGESPLYYMLFSYLMTLMGTADFLKWIDKKLFDKKEHLPKDVFSKENRRVIRSWIQNYIPLILEAEKEEYESDLSHLYFPENIELARASNAAELTLLEHGILPYLQLLQKPSHKKEASFFQAQALTRPQRPVDTVDWPTGGGCASNSSSSKRIIKKERERNPLRILPTTPEGLPRPRPRPSSDFQAPTGGGCASDTNCVVQ
jgi:hypothetical protein